MQPTIQPVIMSPNMAGVSLNLTYNQPFFHPGDQMSGQVHLSVMVPTPILDINFVFKGKVKTQATHHWVERRVHGHGENQRVEYIHHYDTKHQKEKLFGQHQTLHSFGGVILAPGLHTFPFSLTCPHNAPNSFD